MSHPIPEVPGFCAEQIDSTTTDPLPAVLVDVFGRTHGLSKTTAVGRDPGEPGIRIVEASVSRLHAELRCVDDAWHVEDSGSTNGTFVGGNRTAGPTPLADGDLLMFGDIGFTFAEHGRTAKVSESYLRTAKGTIRDEHVRLVSAPADGGGLVLRGEDSMLLGLLQFSLLRLLAETRREQADHDPSQRGFVSSVELQIRLPWDSTDPQGNHVKQLVRRARRSLAKIGLPEVIEARRRFGYRLTCDVLDRPSASPGQG